MKSVVFFLWLVFAAAACGGERILSFHARIEVGWDGMLDVTETIRVRAEGNEIKHGIFRDFPQLYQGRWGLMERRPFEVEEITRNGAAEPFTMERHKAGTRVRIGRADQMIDGGEHTYMLRYRTGRQLLFSDEHDELYWNVTGNEWSFPIDEASAEVVLPESIVLLTRKGFIGPEGSTEESEASGPELHVAAFRAGRPLGQGEGLTVVVTWPPRSLEPAVYEPVPGQFARDNAATFAGLVVMAMMIGWHLFAWVTVGRDPSPGLIIPQFAPPEGYSPAAVRVLSRMAFDSTCFSAAVMGLAVKGALSIGGDAKNHRLERAKDANTEQLTPDETALFGRLFAVRDTLELKQSNHETIGSGRKQLKKSLMAQLRGSHFSNNLRSWVPGLLLGAVGVGLLAIGAPQLPIVLFMTVWLSIWSVGTGALVSQVWRSFRDGKWFSALPLALFSIPFVAGWFFGVFMFFMGAGPLAGIGIVTAVIVNALFFVWIKAPTAHGRRVLDHIDVFKHYLAVAEDDRLAGFTCPEKTPELFEMFLPYAHALGVEQRWSEKFRDVLARAATEAGGQAGYRPRFYTGSNARFTGPMAAAAIGGALGSALTTASTAPSSSSSGGGRSSGRGGGGGGGGGW